MQLSQCKQSDNQNPVGFRPGDSTISLFYLVNEIREAFQDPRSLAFLIIS